MADEMNESGLVAKNVELLGEVKKLKSRLAEVEGDRDAAQARADKAEADFKRVTLDEPVDAVLSEVFAVPVRYIREDLGGHFKFERDDAGQIMFRTKDGEPVQLKGKKREAAFSVDDVKEAVMETEAFAEVIRASGASGSGALGGKARQHDVEQGKAKPAVASPFGLR